MSDIRQKVQNLRLLLSQWVTPKEKRVLKHLKVQGFEILAFANEDVGRHLAILGQYEADETRFFRNTIKSTDICFDIGGNVGFFSLVMAQTASQGVVHVFEPIPLNAAVIRANCELNALRSVRVNNVAVGGEEGTASFSISVDSAYSSMHATGRIAEAQSIDVPLITLDRYITENDIAQVDVMKIDVEGAEGMVLDGGTALLSDPDRRPRMILLELFDENLIPFGTSVAVIIKQMMDFGYRPHVLAAGGERLVKYRTDMATRYYNIIFTPA
jgi:FkbM family methyltransferase